MNTIQQFARRAKFVDIPYRETRPNLRKLQKAIKFDAKTKQEVALNWVNYTWNNLMSRVEKSPRDLNCDFFNVIITLVSGFLGWTFGCGLAAWLAWETVGDFTATTDPNVFALIFWWLVYWVLFMVIFMGIPHCIVNSFREEELDMTESQLKQAIANAIASRDANMENENVILRQELQNALNEIDRVTAIQGNFARQLLYLAKKYDVVAEELQSTNMKIPTNEDLFRRLLKIKIFDKMILDIANNNGKESVSKQADRPLSAVERLRQIYGKGK